MSTFVSTTVHCARCHDHKFDPIPQAEYYGLQAVFAGVDRADRAYDPDPAVHRLRRRPDRPPQAAPATATRPCWPRCSTPRSRPRSPPGRPAAGAAAAAWTVLDPDRDRVGRRARRSTELPDHSVLAGGHRARPRTRTRSPPRPTSRGDHRRPARTPARRPPAAAAGPGRNENGNLHLTEFQVRRSPRPRGPSPITSGRRRLRPGRLGRSPRPSTATPRPPGASTPRSASRTRPSSSWPTTSATGGTTLTVRPPPDVPRRPPDRPVPALGHDRRPGPVRAVGRCPTRSPPSSPIPAGERTTDQTTGAGRALPRRRRSTASSPRCRPGSSSTPAPATSPPTAATSPPGGPRPVHVLKRGDIRQPGAERRARRARRASPACRSRFDLPDRPTRARAAPRWRAGSTDPANPLTWRSIVNRVWQYHFGRGLVDTPNDFGRMGGDPDPPRAARLAGRRRSATAAARSRACTG